MSECGQFFHGKGVLTGDLDCSAYDGHAVVMTKGKLDLGTWQRIFYAEFDGQRAKRIIVKVLGVMAAGAAGG